MNVKHKLLRPAGELKKQVAAAAGQLAELVYPPDIYCISCGKAIPSGRLYSMCDCCLDTIHWANGKLCAACGRLEADIAAIPAGATAAMNYCHEKLVPGMASARRAADALEGLLPREAWPFPVYGDILFY